MNQNTKTRIFHTEGATKVYMNLAVEVQALRGVDVEFYAGELEVLSGPSGSGKSTLLNSLGGLDSASAGRAWFKDTELTAISERQLSRYRRDHVGLVFQFYNLAPSLTAHENVKLVAEVSKNPIRPEEALERVGLSHRIDHFPIEMSGGEQRRVAITRVSAKRPEVLLCDEPVGALDGKTGIQVPEALDRVNVDIGTTTAVITDNASIRKMAHRVIYFADGAIENVEVNESRTLPRDIEW